MGESPFHLDPAKFVQTRKLWGMSWIGSLKIIGRVSGCIQSADFLKSGLRDAVNLNQKIVAAIRIGPAACRHKGFSFSFYLTSYTPATAGGSDCVQVSVARRQSDEQLSRLRLPR